MITKRWIFWFWFACVCVATLPALAQSSTQTGCVNATPCVQTNVFIPTGSAPLAASSVSSNVAFPSSGSNLTLLVSNPSGGATAYMVAGIGAGTVATTANMPIQPGQTVAMPQGQNTYLAAITATGTAALTIQSGTGTPVITYGQMSLVGAITATSSQSPIAPGAGTTSTIVTGGTAVIAVTGPVNGCQVVNPAAAADQGISTAENGYLNAVTTATTTGNGTTGTLQPGQPWTCPAPLKSGSNVSINAATSGHKFGVTVW